MECTSFPRTQPASYTHWNIMTHKHTLKLIQLESSCLTHWHTNTHVLQRIARAQALAAVWWVYYVCNSCHGPLSLAPHVFLSAGFKHAWCLRRRWEKWQYLFLKYINQGMFIMALLYLSLLVWSHNPNLHVSSVPLSFNAVCWMTACYQTWPMSNYRLCQSLRGARLPLGSRFTASFVFVA